MGAHTITHAYLPRLSSEVKREEICGSRTFLEEKFATPVSSFAYPFGFYEAEDVDIVRQLDYVQRMSGNQNGTTSNVNADLKIVNISNRMSAERINELRKYISSKTKGACDFTCHNCYRCSLVHGKSGSGKKEYLFLDE